MATEPHTSKPKPIYLLGLLCLIPFLGGLAGLTLLLLGIIYYKDVWLSLIGGAGIILGIVAWVIAFSALWHSQPIKYGFSQIAQMQLNSLVKDIEFYKLQYGEYPFSLDDVLKADKLANITDPSHFSLRNGAQFYNYHKAGNKYVLFSSGPDGRPHTKDDLYPQITITDSSKIGLIRPTDDELNLGK